MLQFYPDKSSLKEVMSQKLSSTNLKDMCKSNGIFLLADNLESLTNTAHLFFWGFNDINFLADAIEDERNNKKSIRLYLSGNKENEQGRLENFLNNVQKKLNTQNNSERVQIKKNSDVEQNVREVEFQYTKHQKGRVRLLDEVEKRFTLRIYETAPERVIIDVTYDDVGDVKVIKAEIEKLAGREAAIKHISLKALSLENRVALFDQFFLYEFEEWRMEEVKSIKLVKDETYVAEEDEDGESVDDSILTGINSALLQGTALRTNAFVQNSLKRGYYFSQSTIKLTHRREAIKIIIDIVFRGDNRQLEINVSGSYETEDGRDYKKALPIQDQRRYLRYFHDTINGIYDGLTYQQRMSVENAE